MAEVTPPFPVQVSNAYNAWDYGAPYKDLIAEGVVASTDLAVTQRGAGANNSVDVAAGTCWVYGDDNPTQQPTYRCYNNATKNLVVAQDATNPRIALIVAHAYDAHFSGATFTWILEVILGTPAGSPVAPALPNNCLLLATVAVGITGTNIVNANITDNRSRATAGAGNMQGPQGVPSGAVVDWPYGSAQVPAGYILPYGQAISRTTYSVLNGIASAAAYPHGNGDGSTTFNTPDYRGRTGVGQDNMGGVAANRVGTIQSIVGTTLGSAGGASTYTLATGEIPSHSHSMSPNNDANTPNSITDGGNTTGGTSGGYGVSTAGAGGGGAHGNMQPSLIVNKILKT